MLYSLDKFYLIKKRVRINNIKTIIETQHSI